MKRKITQISIVILFIISIIVLNIIISKQKIVSYAINENETNHPNIEFKAYFKDKKGNATNVLEKQQEFFVFGS